MTRMGELAVSLQKSPILCSFKVSRSLEYCYVICRRAYLYSINLPRGPGENPRHITSTQSLHQTHILDNLAPSVPRVPQTLGTDRPVTSKQHAPWSKGVQNRPKPGLQELGNTQQIQSPYFFRGLGECSRDLYVSLREVCQRCYCRSPRFERRV